MIDKSRLFINGEWKRGSGSHFTSFNPANGEMIWQGHEADSSDVSQAIQAANQAFPSWAKLSIDERSSFLLEFANILRASKEDVAEIIAKETGKPLWDSLSEVEAMINKVNISIEAYHTRCPIILKEQPKGQLVTRHRPHGAVAVFGPYNFPCHLPNGHIIPALLAGNTVVFKPSELTPFTAEKHFNYGKKLGYRQVFSI